MTNQNRIAIHNATRSPKKTGSAFVNNLKIKVPGYIPPHTKIAVAPAELTEIARYSNKNNRNKKIIPPIIPNLI